MISLRPDHLKRYRDIARLFIRHGLFELVKTAGIHDVLKDDPSDAPAGPATARADELAADLEKMGPTYIKLGQLLSTRPDILPPPYLEALSRLQDKIEPFSYEEVEAIVHAELGVRISKAFSFFDPKPLAAASLGQVHRAALRDGRVVAVKVQRPGIREKILEEFEVLSQVADMFDRHTSAGKKYEFSVLLEEFRKTLGRELDYRLEAHNLKTLGENLAEFDRIVIPAPVDDYSTSRVLTMDYIRGTKITSLSPVSRVDLHGADLAEQLFRAYLRQLCVDGFLHADPHPGNVFLTDDNRIALLDLGMVIRITPGLQDRILQLLLAIADGRGEDAVEYAIDIGRPRDTFDRPAFEHQVIEIVKANMGVQMKDIQVGRLVLDVGRIAGDNGISLPPEVTMVGQTLLKLDQVGRILDPHFDPNQSIRRNAVELTRKRLWKSLPMGSVLNTVMEAKNFLGHLPNRLNRIMELVANNELKVRTDAVDEALLMEGIQKVANRITTGLIVAAMIVGAALLTRVETPFTIFGYPGIAVLFFFAAAAMGSFLVVKILYSDVKAAKAPRTAPH